MRYEIAVGIAVCLSCSVLTAEGSTTVAKSGDASLVHNDQAGTWAIAAGGATLTLNLDAALDFAVASLVTTSKRAWIIDAGPDTLVTVNGTMRLFGNRAAGFALRTVVPTVSGHTLRLDAVFDLIGSGLLMTRHYVVTSGSPTFETWTTYTPQGGRLTTISNLDALRLNLPNGAVHWLMGLQGDNADSVHDNAFTLQQKTLAIGEHVALGAQGRSSEQIVPWLAVDGSPDEFYVALLWSGAWSLGLDRSDTALGLSLGLGSMTTTLSDTPLEGPHAFFGVVRGGMPQVSASVRSYALQGLRGGRPLTPLVTYNTWFAYGTEIDEPTMRDEMAGAAALGAELFVIDAGWYPGAGAAGPFDFDAGLGNWQPDPVRFPNGLRPLTDYAHSLGLKFGIWVEPERVNLSNVGPPGVEEEWLATNGGHYGSDHAAQICLASDAARAWLMERITTFLDAVQPDYLKWDNNMWINCDRAGHGHGATDGNFAHVRGLYDLLSTLRERYPNLLMENVSGGGKRLDFGMFRYSDVAWMDDRTAPSVHVRHNVEGLSIVFPPAYLLSFVISHDGEPLHDAPDLPLYVRSRMEGALGLCFKGSDLSPADAANLKAEIAVYTGYRSTIGAAASALLTGQARATKGPTWDVLQETTAGAKRLVIFAFQSDPGITKINVKPSGLSAQTMYEVRSVDTGILGTAKGSDLTAQGIDILQCPTSAAHILILTAK